MQFRHAGLSRPATRPSARGALALLILVLGVAPTATAQIREVSGVLGLRFDRLGGGGEPPNAQMLGQARLQVSGVVLNPRYATFSVSGETRRGVVTTPSGYGLLYLGRPTRFAQAQGRLEVAPGALVSGTLDYTVSRTSQEGLAGAAVQQSGGARLAFRGTSRLPSGAASYRQGTARFGSGAPAARYGQASVEVSKSGEQSSVAGGLRTEWTPRVGDVLGRRSTNADLRGTVDLSDALRFSMSASYAELNTFLEPTQSGGLRATLNYQSPGGAVATLAAAHDFTSAFGLRTQTEQVRLDGTRPLGPRLRTGASAVVRRVSLGLSGGGARDQAGFSAAALLEASLPFGGRAATVAGNLGFSAEARTAGDQSPPRALDYRVQATVPAVASDWLVLTSGASVSGQRLVGAGGGALSYSFSQQLLLFLRPVRWSVTAIYSRTELAPLLTAGDPASVALLLAAGGVRRHRTLASELTVQPSAAWSLTGAANYDVEVAPRDGSVLTASGRLAWRPGRDTEVATEAQVYRFSLYPGGDFATFGLGLTKRFRQLEVRSEMHVSRALRDNLPARTYFSTYISRAFAASFR